MVLLLEKLSHSLNFPSRLEHHHHHLNSDALSAGVRGFRSKVSDFISSEYPSTTGLSKKFELINITNRAFAKLVVEIDYPMSRWSPKLTEQYLNYTLNLLNLLNTVNSSVSHLSQAKNSILHALSLINNSPSSADKHLKKINITNLCKEIKLEGPIRIGERIHSEKETVVLQALSLSKKIGILALGSMVSCLCSDAEFYLKIRKFAGGFDDPLIKELDSRFCGEVNGVMEEVKEVNSAVERLCDGLSTGKYSKFVEELKKRLNVMEKSIQSTEKQANNLFSEVLIARNKLLDNIRIH